MKTEKDKYIEEYKKSNHIFDCLGCGAGRWKWRMVDGCIDLRYGHNTKKSAEMARAESAKLAWEHGKGINMD